MGTRNREVGGFIEEVIEMKRMTDRIYIYGAGLYARNIYTILTAQDISISGFVVTFQENQKELYGLPVLNVKEVLQDNIGIIIGVNSHNRAEVMKYLDDSNFNRDRIVQGTDFIEKDATRYDNAPVMEITTNIGCSVNCKYCPQSLLLKNYYAENPNREKTMSIETFEICLNKLPQNARIVFSGMSEPFLNSRCVEMMKMTVESGRKMDLYTTLVGANRGVLQEIAQLPFEYVTLHVADKLQNAHIPVSEEYYDMVEYIVNLKKKDGTCFISMCNAQAEPDARVTGICQGKYEILTALLDRAGNLSDDTLYGRQILSGEITCSFCGQELKRNVLLPDGTVLLCCMDYGLRHPLGNLKEQSYDEIMNGIEMKQIREGMKTDYTKSILCRSCSSASLVNE